MSIDRETRTGLETLCDEVAMEIEAVREAAQDFRTEPFGLLASGALRKLAELREAIGETAATG